jgi:hypothetical protein
MITTLMIRPFGFPTRTTAKYLSWCCSEPGILKRAELAARLERSAGKHLVIVEYGPRHNFSREWVYNEPDIDGAKVVWAREMGARDEELVKYFSGREVWRVRVEE